VGGREKSAPGGGCHEYELYWAQTKKSTMNEKTASLTPVALGLATEYIGELGWSAIV